MSHVTPFNVNQTVPQDNINSKFIKILLTAAYILTNSYPKSNIDIMAFFQIYLESR